MAKLKFKVGDKVTIIGNGSSKLKHYFSVGDEVEIFRAQKNDPHHGSVYDCCRKHNGDCYWVAEADLQLIDVKQNLKESNMKAMKDAVLTVAKQLAKANNTVTTLEIKTELRRDYPYYFWTQAIVSSYMDQLAGDGVFTYKDNGIYRIYSLVTAAPTKSVMTKTSVANPAKTTRVRRKSGITVDSLVTNPDFEALTIKNKSGKVVTYSKATIKDQKKSPKAIAIRYMGSVLSVTVKGTVYNF